jgi:DNA invertase Pin-like site-specific DNA recombinase
MLKPPNLQQKMHLKIIPGSRVFGYARVSTYYQKMYGISLEAQEDRILKYCEQNKLTLQYLYSDPAKSGKSIKNKPGIQALLNNIKEDDIYIFTSVSRLGRATSDNLHILDILHKANCKLVILDLCIDTTTIQGTMMFQISSVMSETERKLISQRTSEVMQYMKQKKILRTKPPFGYQIIEINEKKKIVENPEEQKVIMFIKQLVKTYPTIKLSTIMKALLENNMTLRKGKMYHEGIRSILARENIR